MSLADQSATGMLSATGVLVTNVGRSARLRRLGVMPRDVILRWGARPVADVAGLQAAAVAEPEPAGVEVWRDQERVRLGAKGGARGGGEGR
jgi:S1-C subfamily serine protease